MGEVRCRDDAGAEERDAGGRCGARGCERADRDDVQPRGGGGEAGDGAVLGLRASDRVADARVFGHAVCGGEPGGVGGGHNVLRDVRRVDVPRGVGELLLGGAGALHELHDGGKRVQHGVHCRGMGHELQLRQHGLALPVQLRSYGDSEGLLRSLCYVSSYVGLFVGTWIGGGSLFQGIFRYHEFFRLQKTMILN